MRLVRVVTRTRWFFCGAVADLGEEVVDLAFDGADFDYGVDEAGGADDLFYDYAGGFGELVGAGGGGDVDDLAGAGLELFEAEGAVVHGGGQAEAVVDEVLFAAAVAVPHAVELRDGDVGLVDEEEVVAGEVVEECGRGLAGETAGEVAGVVLDAVAVAYGLDHLEVETGALVDALGFDEAAFCFELGPPLDDLGEDGVAWRRFCARVGRRSGTWGRWAGGSTSGLTVPKRGSI